MTDIVSPEKRSLMMSGIGPKDTKPEMIVRKGLHSRGFRYRLHVKNLPGTPDLVLLRYHAVIFVNGCFWHGHGCPLFKWPSTREEFWRNKINRNREKDIDSRAALLAAEWRVGVVWECAVKGTTRLPVDKVIEQLSDWLRSTATFKEIRGTDHDT
ncbi:MAG: very short patch repair endonuclease [Prosthecochloris sp.]|uniref:very short patch repair endonuclease n=1 Tax=Prosthecochloris sp. TaxID=290513 RepID=UPI0013CA4476|nr:very short patch repair endonuclease [Prosthecochloris sp.]NEX12286.1 very short patch repair endonuclease [Prosthecochloris sp.]